MYFKDDFTEIEVCFLFDIIIIIIIIIIIMQIYIAP